MSINQETGLWQCFKYKQKGNFEQLVAFMEGISINAARIFIGRKLLDSPELIFYKSRSRPESETVVGVSKINEIAKDFKPLTYEFSRNSYSLSERLAFKMAFERSLPLGELMFCEKGKYSRRLIIPYRYKDSDSMFFFQARALGNSPLKYLNPTEKDTGELHKCSNILYPYNEESKYVMVTEGPLDSITLQSSNVNATCINGSYISAIQARKLKDWANSNGAIIILAFDNDDAGRKGMECSAKILGGVGADKVMFCHPPKEYGDWNEFLVKRGASEVRNYVYGNINKSKLEYLLISQLS